MFNEKTNKYEGYIYCITNQVNGKRYIGQTTRTIDQRWKQHKEDAKKIDTLLYRAIKKYNIDNFEIKQIKKVEASTFDELKNLLNILEIKYIDEYETIMFNNKGYNMTIGGDSPSENNKKPVDMYDLNGNLIASFCSISDASIKTGSSGSAIQYCCRGERSVYTVREHVFRYKGDPFDKYSINKKCKKICYKFDLCGVLTNTYISITEAAKENNLNRHSLETAINRCTNLNDNYYALTPEIDLNKYRRVAKINREIGMYDKDTGNLLKIFKKMSCIKDFLNKDCRIDSHIMRACNDFNKLAYGYRWQYIN